MIKKYRVSVLFLVIALSILFSIMYFTSRPQLEYIISKSYFHDFEIHGDEVYIKCDIRVKNNSAKTIKFYIFEDASMEKLVLEDKAYVYEEDNMDEKKIFTIEPNSTKDYCNVIFKGTSSGETTREDRNPPQIVKFEEVE